MTAVSETEARSKLWPIMALLAAMLIWGSAAVFLRSLALSATPENSLALRYVFLAVICAVALAVLGTWRIPRADWFRFALAGVIGMAGYNWFSTLGFARVPAGLGTIITMFEPLMIAFLAWAMLKETLSRSIFAGLAVSLLGAVVLFWPDIVSTQASTTSWRGVTELLICCICWALYTIFTKPLLERHAPFTVVAVTMVIAAPFMIWPASEPLLPLAASLNARQWFELLFLVVASGLLGTLFWNYGSKHLPGAATGAFLYLIPVVAVIAGALILDEAITIWIVTGGALMLAGVAIAQFGLPRFE
jgi:drug/metabolite transporter (DMT)-like permease